MGAARRRRFAAAVALACAALPAAADPGMMASEVGLEPSRQIHDARLFEDVVVAPIPMSNPTFGTGLAVVVMPFYYLGEGSPLSNTAVAAAYTSNDTWGLGAAQSTRLRGDALRL